MTGSESVDSLEASAAERSSYRHNWWHVVAVVPLLAVARVSSELVYGDPLSTPMFVLAGSGLLFFLAFSLPVAVFLDCRYVADVSAGTPNRGLLTGLAAVVVVPVYVTPHPIAVLAPVLVCLPYLVVRHRHAPLVG